MCEAWVCLRSAQLLSKYGVESLMTWHDAPTREAAWDVLLDYGEQVLQDRFSQVSKEGRGAGGARMGREEEEARTVGAPLVCACVRACVCVYV
jgi:predicted secreted protein